MYLVCTYLCEKMAVREGKRPRTPASGYIPGQSREVGPTLGGVFRGEGAGTNQLVVTVWRTLVTTSHVDAGSPSALSNHRDSGRAGPTELRFVLTGNWQLSQRTATACARVDLFKLAQPALVHRADGGAKTREVPARVFLFALLVRVFAL